MANRHLRCIVLGGLSNLDVTSAVQLLRVVIARLQGGRLSWEAARGSPLFALKHWFKARGWSVLRPWVWQVGRFYPTLIDLSVPASISFGQVAHVLRLGWRWHHWQAFRNCGRRDSDVDIS